jgi:maleate cis-trans isomerase
MDHESNRCAVELSDARVGMLGYTCLVAITAGYVLPDATLFAPGVVAAEIVRSAANSR